MPAEPRRRRPHRLLTAFAGGAALVALIVFGMLRAGSPAAPPTPAELAHLSHVDGYVTQATSTRIIMQRADGALLNIDPGDLPQGELEHLEQHARIGVATRLFIRRRGDRLEAVGLRHLKRFRGVDLRPARPVTRASAASIHRGQHQADVLERLGVPASFEFRSDRDCWTWPSTHRGSTFEVCFDRHSPAPVVSFGDGSPTPS